MKKLLVMSTVITVAISGCSSTSRKEELQKQYEKQLEPYKVHLINSCSYAGKGVEVTDYKPFFSDDVEKSEYETRAQYLARMKSKVPEYITFRAKVGYTSYDAEKGVMHINITRYGQPRGLQLTDIQEQDEKAFKNATPITTINLKNPAGRSYPRISLKDEIPYHTQIMGETAYGYQKEFTAARVDEYFASLGMLDSFKSRVDEINYYVDIPMTGYEAMSVKDSLEIEFTIRSVAPYLLSYKKGVSDATISDPYSFAKFEHVFVGDYCSSTLVDAKSGKRYNAQLKIDLPVFDYKIN